MNWLRKLFECPLGCGAQWIGIFTVHSCARETGVKG